MLKPSRSMRSDWGRASGTTRSSGSCWREFYVLDPCVRVSHNPGRVKRLSLVWFVCVCLQTSALSAPFVHLHADAAHETDHHDGRVVHRHVAGHATPAQHHHDHDESAGVRLSAVEASESVEASAEPTTFAIGALSARPSVSAISLAPPEAVIEITQPAAPATPPPNDVGPPLSNAPDLSTSSLRGPPR